ncbi:hypothetical protein IV203_032408 [Nitzschia inconspicua]|uniref:Uncharacterized protein n=1 Tax=Nitzschia inconspicua TaxID=303405 RepID=A0A9K3PES2_9STRA|nr:hypothetical protein IV203_032408 [Nitzschia inconspicua]
MSSEDARTPSPPADLENNPLGIIQKAVSSQDGSKVSLGLGKGAAKALSQQHPSIESRDGLHNDRGTDDFLHLHDAGQVPAENQGVNVNQDDVLLQGANMENPAEDQGSIQEAHAMENQGVDMAEKQGSIHFVVMKNSFKTPSVCFLKALFRCVKSVLLRYNHFASTLMDMGFELNPYDPCVANKMVNGKQCTVAWYVDDNKISHIDPQVVTNVITALEGHIGEMTVTSGCCHKCLGMDITFNSNGTVSILMEDFDGTVSILMEDYLKSVIEFLGEPISSSNAADKGLLDVNPDSPAVASKERVDLYGSIVPKGPKKSSFKVPARHFDKNDHGLKAKASEPNDLEDEDVFDEPDEGFEDLADEVSRMGIGSDDDDDDDDGDDAETMGFKSVHFTGDTKSFVGGGVARKKRYYHLPPVLPYVLDKCNDEHLRPRIARCMVISKLKGRDASKKKVMQEMRIPLPFKVQHRYVTKEEDPIFYGKREIKYP